MDFSEHVEYAGDAASSRIDAQWWLLFAIMVAGKSSEQTAVKLQKFIRSHPFKYEVPFAVIADYYRRGTLRKNLERVKVGQYSRIEQAFIGVSVTLPEMLYSDEANSLDPGQHNDPRNWDVRALEGVHGVGPKTARWFYSLCHPDARVAALDTHVLKFLRDQGVDAPKNTPSAGKIYNKLETRFLEHADRLKIKPRELDFMAWVIYRNNGHMVFD